MSIDPWTLGLQAFNALILVWLLGRFLFRPVAAAIAARGASIATSFASIDTARGEVEATRSDARAALAEAVARREAALGDAAADTETLRRDALAAARAERDALLAAGRTETERAGEDASRGLERDAGLLALDLAARLVERLPIDARFAGYPERLAAGLAALPAPVRAELGNGEKLHVSAAREPSAAERETLRDALRGALGHDVELEIAVDPALIAGLELDAAHVAVGDNLRRDLGSLAVSLDAHAHAEG